MNIFSAETGNTLNKHGVFPFFFEMRQNFKWLFISG